MAHKSKEWYLTGNCTLPDGRTIYFNGKTNAVSSNQAHFNLCWDIKSCFNVKEFVNPVITDCGTFNSSMFLARRATPYPIKYYADKERKEEIEVVRKPGGCATEAYGEEGEEIVDLNDPNYRI